MEKPSARPYFFLPRVIPERYSRGWEGYRTLVLGVFHVCTIECCPLRAECLADSSRFDSLCPQYEGKGDYYRLSNSNEIEVESYLEGEVNYPTYSSITKYLLRTNRHVVQASRRELWDSIAYTNFLQNFSGEYDTLSYALAPELFDSQLPAFAAVLKELRPEVIYVIDTAVADCLRAHEADFPGLRFIDENQDWTLPIYRFTFNIAPKAAPKEILSSLKSFHSIGDEAARLQKILSCLERGRSRAKAPDARQTEVLPHIWDSEFEGYLYRRLLEISLPERASEKLHRILQNLYAQGITSAPDKIVFKKLAPGFETQYKRDGLIVELASALSADSPQDPPVKPFNLARALFYDCGSKAQWRTERLKEYTTHQPICGTAIRNLLGEMGK